MKTLFIILIGIALGAGLMAWIYFGDQERTLPAAPVPETKLTREVTLAQGRVVDAENRGVVGVSVRCAVDLKLMDAAAFDSVPATMTTQTDAEGRFVCRALTSADSLDLIVTVDGFEDQPQSVKLGADDLLFVLTSDAQIGARIDPPEPKSKN